MAYWGCYRWLLTCALKGKLCCMDCPRTMTKCMSLHAPDMWSLINFKRDRRGQLHYNMTSVFVPIWSKAGLLRITQLWQFILLIHQQYDLCEVGWKRDQQDYLSQIILSQSENFHFQGAMGVLPYLGVGNFIRGSYLFLRCRTGWGMREGFTQVERGAYFNI